MALQELFQAVEKNVAKVQGVIDDIRQGGIDPYGARVEGGEFLDQERVGRRSSSDEDSARGRFAESRSSPNRSRKATSE